MPDIDTLAAIIRDELDTEEQDAQAATAGPWWHNPTKLWMGPEAFEAYDRTKGEEFVGYGDPHPFTGCIAATGPADHPQAMKDADHIARHDPAAVLRRVARDRKLLDLLLADRHRVTEDQYYTCPAATKERDGGVYGEGDHPGPCSCGRDDRVAEALTLFAEPYTQEN